MSKHYPLHELQNEHARVRRIVADIRDKAAAMYAVDGDAIRSGLPELIGMAERAIDPNSENVMPLDDAINELAAANQSLTADLARAQGERDVLRADGERMRRALTGIISYATAAKEGLRIGLHVATASIFGNIQKEAALALSLPALATQPTEKQPNE